MDDTARCAGPGCGKLLPGAATGRPARYCGPNCRQAARRAKVRAEEEAAERAARLAEARSTASRLRRPMETARAGVSAAAGLVFDCAADAGRPRAELSRAADAMLAAARELAGLARQYRDAADLARQLDS